MIKGKKFENIAAFVKKNKKELIFVALILFIGAFFRLYKISSYMTFLGDEGRDAVIVRRIFTELHPPLIGPGTSVGGMYLGPLYYYMMAIPLLVAGFSPVGPAVMVALIGVITILFIWWIGREWFGKSAGIIAALLYAISPTVIIYSRSSWNPNIMPFFALLSIYSICQVWIRKKFNWLIVLGLSLAFVLQSHYLGLLLIPTIFVFWALTLRDLKLAGNLKLEMKNFWQKTLVGLGLFLALMSPLLVFDIRHNFINANAMYKFLMERQNVVTFDLFQMFLNIPKTLQLVTGSLMAGKYNLPTIAVSLIIAAGVIFVIAGGLFFKKKIKIKKEHWLITLWFAFGILGLSVYKQSIYDHYFGFLFPAPFLIMGMIISKFVDGKILLKLIGGALLICLVYINLKASPLRKDPNRLLGRSISVSKVIEENSDGKPFNLAVIADTNYEDGYKYFLLKDKYPVVEIDSQKPDTITDQLFVVCELFPSSKCDPTHSPKAQVANFGWSKIEGVWEVEGATVYKLVHSE